MDKKDCGRKHYVVADVADTVELSGKVVLPTDKSALEEINRWLVSISLEQRALDVQPYEIKKSKQHTHIILFNTKMKFGYYKRFLHKYDASVHQSTYKIFKKPTRRVRNPDSIKVSLLYNVAFKNENF